MHLFSVALLLIDQGFPLGQATRDRALGALGTVFGAAVVAAGRRGHALRQAGDRLDTELP